MGGKEQLDCIKFTVYGEPVAQGRPRGSIRNGRCICEIQQNQSNSNSMWHWLRLSIAQKQLLLVLSQMDVKVYRQMPKSVSNSKKKKEKAEKGLLRPTTKPDVDNYVKGVKDALNHLIYKDDSQVVDLKVSKFYSEEPRVEIKIKEVSA
ncbi:RusA family crossover junction endodeoxyribonuclease [Bacillus subtilis]|uniref:RusA family crossover junction endodeoxyribonuclease n=1 Tax=Bacillus subtilis TaxID=1423 RepID=UPI004045DE7B